MALNRAEENMRVYVHMHEFRHTHILKMYFLFKNKSGFYLFFLEI